MQLAQCSDDEFSSGSSVDPSQLVHDWNPAFDGSSNVKASSSTQKTRTHPSEPKPSTVTTNDGKETGTRDSSQRVSSNNEEKNKKEQIRIVLGQSILDWQKERRGDNVTEKGTEWVTIRHEHNGPLPAGAELTVSSSTASLVYETNGGPREQTGQLISSESSTGAWVDCVAVYDRERQCHVLSKVDWTASLKRVRKQNVDPSVKPPSKNKPQKKVRKAASGKNRRRRSTKEQSRPAK